MLIAAGTALSALALIWVVMEIDWPAFFEAMQSIKPAYVALACLSTVASASIRSLRWYRIAGGRRGQLRYFWHAYNIGQFGNFIYPLRGGDILRLWTLSRLTGLPFGHSLTSGVLDRFADAAVMAIALAVVLAIYSTSLLGGYGVLLAIGAIAAVGTLLIAFVLHGHRLQGTVDAIAARLPPRLAYVLQHGLERALEIARLLRQRGRLLGIVALTVASAVADYTTIWIILFAFGWNLPFFAAVTIGVCLHAGISIPSAPANVGVMQVAVIIALGLFDIGISDAIAYSVVLQLTGFSVFGLLGLWAIAKFGLRRRPGEVTENA